MSVQKKILLLGPTGVGKTDLSLELSALTKSPIISVDSRQCYKFLDIGTAKPTEENLSRVKHYNISVLDPKEQESAGKFLERLNTYTLEECNPILYVGGSTLHIQSLLFGLNEALPQANSVRISRLNELAKTHPEHLKDLLFAIDPVYAESTQGFNPQRIVRAIDVWMETGKPFSSFHNTNFSKPTSNFLVIGLTRSRINLYKRAEARVDEMIANGLMEEISDLLSNGYSFTDPGLSSVGYKEFADYFNGNKTLDQCIDQVKTSTRRYIKRQLTWFKRWDFVHWFDMDSLPTSVLHGQIEQKITNFLQN